MKTAFLIFLAMLAFAGNSFICRLALANNAIDPISFTSIRLVSGALGLMLIVLIMPSLSTQMGNHSLDKTSNRSFFRFSKSNIIGSLMLFIYAILFSLAYINLDAGVGALLLFGSVQLTMLGFNLLNGGKISIMETFGIVIASLGLVILLAPNEFSPDLTASAVMILSGIAWAFYTLNGQSNATIDPTINTAKNFMLTIPLVLISLFIALSFFSLDSFSKLSFNLSLNGILLASLSGIVMSALGYSIWYAVLPKLSITVAACAQLSVPVLAAIGGFILIDEALTYRFLIATVLTLMGITITVFAKKPA